MKLNELKDPQPILIGTTHAKLHIGALTKAREATPEVKAVKGVKEVQAAPAIPEKKDKKGKVTQEAVEAVEAVEGVKAVKAKSAQPAKPAIQTVYLQANTKEIAYEVAARMKDQGYNCECDDNGEIIILTGDDFKSDRFNSFFLLTYKDETDKSIRAAFKKCKAKTGYNKLAQDIIDEERAAEAKIKREANAAKLKAEKEAQKEAAEEEEKAKPKPKKKAPMKKAAPKKAGRNMDK